MAIRYVPHFIAEVFVTFIENDLLSVFVNKSQISYVGVLVCAPAYDSSDLLSLQLNRRRFVTCVTMSCVKEGRLNAVLKD